MNEFTRHTSARSPDNPKAVLFPTKSYTLVKVPATIPAITRVRGAQGNVPNGGSTRDTTLTLSGTAEPGKSVEIRDGSTLKGTAPVDLSGNWSLTVTGLTIASHSFTAIGLYGSGPVSNVWKVQVLKQPLTITAFKDVYGNLYYNGSTASNNGPDLSGQGAPRGFLSVVVQGVGAPGPGMVNLWHSYIAENGRRVTGAHSSNPMRAMLPDGSFQIDGVGRILGWRYSSNVPRQVIQVWLEVPSTGERSPTFSFTFVPVPNTKRDGTTASVAADVDPSFVVESTQGQGDTRLEITPGIASEHPPAQ